MLEPLNEQTILNSFKSATEFSENLRQSLQIIGEGIFLL